MIRNFRPFNTRCKSCLAGKAIKTADVRVGCRKCGANSYYLDVGKADATLEMRKAISAGQLRKPTDFCCVDCGSPARMYDHRDYNKPLDVSPVCHGCNLRRGPAIPRAGFVEWCIESGFPPYRMRLRGMQMLERMGIDPSPLKRYPGWMTAEDWREIWPELAKKAA